MPPPRGPITLVLVRGSLLTLPTCGCGSGSGDGDTPDAGIPDAAPPPALAELRVRRLLARQYINTVEDLLGPAAAIAANPPDDLPFHGFASIGASELSIAPSL